MTGAFKEYAKSVYEATFASEMAAAAMRNGVKMDEAERHAQKEAIKASILQTISKYPDEEPAEIWRGIYEIHVHRKSGIDDAAVIAKVIKADQSWKKSSGHALLQRDLNIRVKAGELANELRDVSWLKEQIAGSVFDLFATFKDGGKRFCFGCLQCKTSIRDRVTRDREPSIMAMQSFFWSAVLVLDGDFLKLPKFKAMVEGGSTEYKENGWHGMYVFSDTFKGKRIYPLSVDFGQFAKHAVQAMNYWRAQRQWFNQSWLAE